MADDAEAPSKPGRWRLIRSAIVFQFKLMADGLRDLIFAPISLVLAFVDIIFGGTRFYNLMSLGQRTDHWINLFGNYRDDGEGLDDAINRVESVIAEQYEKGGVTASAKRTVDRALDKISREKKPDVD